MATVKVVLLLGFLGLLFLQSLDCKPIGRDEEKKVDFIKKVHVVFMNHLDAGYSLPGRIAYLVNILNTYWRWYLPKAADMAQILRDEGAAESFIYTTHPWLLTTFFNCPEGFETGGFTLECPDEETTNKVRAGISRGDITWHAGPMNMQHEFANDVIYRFSLNQSLELDTMFNITHPARVLRNTDVPALTQAVIPHLVAANITGVSVGTNGGAKPIDLPRGVFRWRRPGAAEGEEVLATWHFGGYPSRPLTVADPGGLSREDCVILEDLQFPEALCFAFKGDNAGPPASVFLIKQWFRILRAQFPDADIFASTLGSFFAAVEPIREQLPVVTKEFGDPWIEGVASDPRKTAEYRAASRAIKECFDNEECALDDPRFQAAAPYIVKEFEHTWGVHRLSDIDQGDPYQISVNSWLEQRRMLNFTLEALGDHPVVQNIQEELREVQTGLDLSGYEETTNRVFQCGENRDVTIGFSSAGHVNLLNYKGVEWASGLSSIGEIMYRTQGAPNSTASCSFNSTANQRPGKSAATNQNTGKSAATNQNTGKSAATNQKSVNTVAANQKQFESLTANEKEFWQSLANPSSKYMEFDTKKSPQPKNDGFVYWPTTLSRVYQRGVATCEYVAELTFQNESAHAQYGAPSAIYLSYRINEAEPGLQVEVHLIDKACTLAKEGTFVKFNFSGTPGEGERSKWSMDKLGVAVDPYNVAANGSGFLHSVDTGVGYSLPDDSSALWLRTLDAPLISWMTPTQGPFAAHDLTNIIGNESISAVTFNLHNNNWGTNYIYWYPYLEEDRIYKARFFLKFQDQQ